ncbi:MAG TPA: hypothetical protein VM712_03315, partial [Gaiellales bacterium]|nr:hypothetical protein [Gaiellales bacterium]
AVGHDEELLLLDAGFTHAQRAALAPHCTLVDAPEAASHPTLYKPFPHLLDLDAVVVVLDADALVTTRFDDTAAAARAGRVVAFPDPAAGRFFEEWADFWELRAPLRREAYVSAGYLVFSTRRHPDLLPRWWEACQGVFDRQIVWQKADRRSRPSPDDQEALNALLMSEVPSGTVELLPRGEIVHGLEAMSVHVHDPATLRCERAGVPVRFLHAGGQPKPWDAKARRQFRPDAYNRLLRHVLHAPDAALPFPPCERLPLWLHDGAPGAAALWTGGLANGALERSFVIETSKGVLSPRMYAGLRRSWRVVRPAA